jgi:hypothetical protein
MGYTYLCKSTSLASFHKPKANTDERRARRGGQRTVSLVRQPDDESLESSRGGPSTEYASTHADYLFAIEQEAGWTRSPSSSNVAVITFQYVARVPKYTGTDSSGPTSAFPMAMRLNPSFAMGRPDWPFKDR